MTLFDGSVCYATCNYTWTSDENGVNPNPIFLWAETRDEAT